MAKPVEPERGRARRKMSTWWHQERLDAVLGVLRDLRVQTVLDLGCGSGDLMLPLLELEQITQIIGLDLSEPSLARCRARLAVHPRGGLAQVRHGSMTAAHPDLAGYDCACLVETIEHLPLSALPALEAAVFGVMQPAHVLVTTPNAAFNDLLGVPRTRFRRPDHHFEWTRAQFRHWADGVAARRGYGVTCSNIAGAHPDLGGASQLAVFSRL